MSRRCSNPTNELLTIVAQASGLLGIVASMPGMGLSLTVSQIVLGTAQRDVSAALVVTLQKLTDANAVPFVLVASILIPLLLLPLARWLGTIGETAPAAASPASAPGAS